MAKWLATQEGFEGGAKKLDLRLKEIDAVTSADLQRVAKKILDKNKISFVVVGATSNKKQLESIIKNTKL